MFFILVYYRKTTYVIITIKLCKNNEIFVEFATQFTNWCNNCTNLLNKDLRYNHTSLFVVLTNCFRYCNTVYLMLYSHILSVTRDSSSQHIFLVQTTILFLQYIQVWLNHLWGTFPLCTQLAEVQCIWITFDNDRCWVHSFCSWLTYVNDIPCTNATHSTNNHTSVKVKATNLKCHMRPFIVTGSKHKVSTDASMAMQVSAEHSYRYTWMASSMVMWQQNLMQPVCLLPVSSPWPTT